MMIPNTNGEQQVVVGLAVGVVTCAPLTGMVGGAFIAQDWD